MALDLIRVRNTELDRVARRATAANLSAGHAAVAARRLRLRRGLFDRLRHRSRALEQFRSPTAAPAAYCGCENAGWAR